MKKKIFLILFLLLVINIYKQTDTISIIPDSSIRLRVIPNSNDSLDVNIKEQVKIVQFHPSYISCTSYL